MKKIYMDNGATTRVTEPVFEAMKPYFCEIWGNPSSMHDYGYEAHHAVENARKQVAKAINADVNEIYFTGCGTESDNWAARRIRISKRAGTSSPRRSSITPFCTPASSWKRKALK